MLALLLLLPAPPTAAAAAAAIAPAPSTKFSPATLARIHNETGLDAEQVDNVMKLVNKPEQDSLRWEAFYGYCENIADGRGVTFGIFGATTGGPNDRGPDGPRVFLEFDDDWALTGGGTVQGGLQRAGLTEGEGVTFKNGKVSFAAPARKTQRTFCTKVRALSENAAWRQAMWTVFLELYWHAAVQAATARGYSSALTIGALVDCALNQGTEGPASLKWILARLATSYASEADFLRAFLSKRATVVDTRQFNQPPNGRARVRQWARLLKMGVWQLKSCDAAVEMVTSWNLA